MGKDRHYGAVKIVSEKSSIRNVSRCRRVAKAYLRKTTVIVDGSEDEFDGKTLGFNHFDNPQRDEHTNEIRAKINDVLTHLIGLDYIDLVSGSYPQNGLSRQYQRNGSRGDAHHLSGVARYAQQLRQRSTRPSAGSTQ